MHLKMKKQIFPLEKLSLQATKIKMVVFDFDGVFTDNRVIVLQDGSEGVLCNRSDGLGLEMLRDAGVELLVISAEINPVVSARCTKLRIPCMQGIKDKLETLKREVEKRSVSLDETVFIGNDINDVPCLENVGFPVCVADAHPDVFVSVHYVTSRNGGYGAVRELCDAIREGKNENSGISAI